MAPIRPNAATGLRPFLRAAPGIRPPFLARTASPPQLPAQRWHSSVNPDEVSHFNALASEWWDPHGSSRLLHLMNPLRHDFINACLTSQPEARPSSLTYLDIGCGGGIFAESAARLPSTSSVTAIDPTPSVLAIAKAHAKKDPMLASKLSYQQKSIEELPTPEKGYDVVSVFEVIEHIDQPAAFLDKVKPFVRPGGWLVMSTIARTWMSWFTTNLVAEDLLRIVPPGTHDWNKYINEHELRRYFAGKGWHSPRVMGVVYIPGVGWREVKGSEKVGNYFFAVRRDAEES
ncbi:Hexaprenyldihydroxybenzoate methyltransferase-like protein [Emericellopsis cladophorae]|uniref:Ubiquinone biosynthesis O-methyltransferase, mitochondrial n=1 Tax=Emericellopsis cladophorae TaxID=2686198 RepID=A0A9P9Y742_9HYPO|nr:Hexaprenyldihydroxybenzoate methyltransferase-like protein [Emericellopsis cladophorae]KAI6784518.1 Hexaprenyldihydroxybenzoate methyltransferase-like protein [Emericellopsis cladophorae]